MGVSAERAFCDGRGDSGESWRDYLILNSAQTTDNSGLSSGFLAILYQT
jgi:hypothetical protein